MILDKLECVKKTSSGWTARCPAHEDQRSSLSISTGDDGRTLIHCHAGCTPEQVVGKLGLRMADLMPSSNGKQHGDGKPKIETTYSYTDEAGDLLYQVCRMIPKDFRQRKPKDGGGWEWKIGNVRRVLYRLPQLLAAAITAIVFIVEGEKDVDRLVKAGLVATCNSGGADSGKGEKWLPEFNQHFRGRRVVILPDKDKAGRKHAQHVVSGLHGIAAEIKVVELPGSGKDVSDWLDAGGTVEELLRIVEAAPSWTPETAPSTITAKPILSWKPFPVSALPEPIRTYVRRAAAAIGVDPSYIATALLAAMAGSIGNSRLILLKRGWVEPAVLWGVLVGDSGTLKSPAIDAATKHVRQRQARAIEAYRQEIEEYERNLERYKADLDRWKHGGKKKGEPPPEELVKPACERFTCSDVTVEGLAVLLADAWRGLLLVRDELAGWIGGFDQYRAGGRGSDTAHWLTIYGARDLLVDRKTTDRKTIFVRRATVSICGGIQPETLRRAIGERHVEDGLLARLLLAMPPRRPKQWTETEIDEHLDQRIDRLFDQLYRLEPKQDDSDRPEPIMLGLSATGIRSACHQVATRARRWSSLRRRAFFVAPRQAAAGEKGTGECLSARLLQVRVGSLTTSSVPLPGHCYRRIRTSRGRTMLAAKTVIEIQRLLDAKTHSQRRIAVLLGVSRGSVAAIASGKRRAELADECDDAPAEHAGPPARCPGCGGLVYMPCLLCRLRKENPCVTRRRTADIPALLRLDLRPEHRERYEEVRAWRKTISTNHERARS